MLPELVSSASGTALKPRKSSSSSHAALVAHCAHTLLDTWAVSPWRARGMASSSLGSPQHLAWMPRGSPAQESNQRLLGFPVFYLPVICVTLGMLPP